MDNDKTKKLLLYVAKNKGDSEIDKVNRYIKNGADINGLDEKGYSLLSILCDSETPNMELIDLLIKEGANVNSVSKDNHGSEFTPWLYAIKHKNDALFEKLLSNGADINWKNSKGDGCLWLVFKQKSEKMNDYFIKNMKRADEIDLTGYIYSDIELNMEHVKLLIEKGANSKKSIRTLYAAVSNKQEELVKMLIDSGYNVNELRTGEFLDNRLSCLHTAIESNFIGIAKLLIDAGADVNTKDEKGASPLMKCRTLEAIKLLVENGADVLCRDNEYKNVLMYLDRTRDNEELMEMLYYLISKGVSLNALDYEGESVLRHATHRMPVQFTTFIRMELGIPVKARELLSYISLGKNRYGKLDIEFMKRMIANGADYKQSEKNNASALLLACKSGDLDAVKFFAEDLKMDTYIPDEHENGALHYAGSIDVIRYLTSKGTVGSPQRGLDVNFQNKNGETALIKLAYGYSDDNKQQKHTVDILKELITQGSDINAKAENGYSLLNIVVGKIFSNITHGSDDNKYTEKDFQKDYEFLSYLIKNNIDVNWKSKDKEPVIFLFDKIRNNKQIEEQREHVSKIINLFIDNGLELKNMGKDDDVSLISWAVKKELPEVVENLVAHGIDINSTSGYDNKTPIEQLFNTMKRENSSDKPLSDLYKGLFHVLLELGADFKTVEKELKELHPINNRFFIKDDIDNMLSEIEKTKETRMYNSAVKANQQNDYSGISI